VDYDNAAAIMRITNDRMDSIVVIAEQYHDFDKEGFSVITINGLPAYIRRKNDYCVVKYRYDNMLYTLTSMYEYEGLIEISECI
jgi:hypothetical protein